MKLSFSSDPASRQSVDLVVSFVYKDRESFGTARSELSKAFGPLAILPVTTGDFKGAEKESSLVYLDRKSGPKRLLLIGLGGRGGNAAERFRRAAGTAAKQASQLNSKSVAMMIPASIEKPPDAIRAIGEGALLSLYRFDKYKKKDPEGRDHQIESIVLCSVRGGGIPGSAKAIVEAQIVSDAAFVARNLSNAPANEIYPETLAQTAAELGKGAGFDVTVLDEAKIMELGMGGVIGVSQGSVRPPRFLILEYGKSKTKKPIVLVGKGVTFDSGGISIKPSAGMGEMKMDMAGAAAVIGTFVAVAGLKLPVHIVGLIPAVENMPSGNSIRPGDILRHYNGLTSEVDNTDAEGRLILADALSYADRFKPAAIIDLATLTGACVVALGHHAAGMMGNDAAIMSSLKAAGEKTFERVWELPLFEEYEKQIKSEIADVKNVGGRWAGTITAALFLKKFVGDHKWVHLDIAGTAMQEETNFYIPKGGSGFGVRLLTELLRKWK